MSIQILKEIKQSLGLTNHDIAVVSGVPFSTVQKVFSGTTRSPRKETILALEKSLQLPSLLEHPYIKNLISQSDRNESDNTQTEHTAASGIDPSSFLIEKCNSTASIVSEMLPEYHTRSNNKYPKLDINNLDRQGSYTVKDLDRLPDNIRAELIDGVIIVMEAPSTTHQKILISILSQLYPCVEQHEECELLAAPVDVQLDCDNKTMVQPDILVTCDKKKDKIKNIYGAPDFIIEICSPSTRRKDMIDKLRKYDNAGVREYWIVDPESESITKYDFTKDMHMNQFTFEDTVNVSISDGKCEIDFKKVKAHM